MDTKIITNQTAFSTLSNQGSSSKTLEGSMQLNDKTVKVENLAEKNVDQGNTVWGGFCSVFSQVKNVLADSFKAATPVFTAEEITTHLSILKESKEKISRVQNKIPTVFKENKEIADIVDEEKNRIDIGSIFKTAIVSVGTQLKFDGLDSIKTSKEMKIEAKKIEISMNDKRIELLTELVDKYQKERLDYVNELQNKDFKSIAPEKIKNVDITPFKAIMYPAKELLTIEETFKDKMIFLRNLIKATQPKNQEVLLQHLEGVISASEGFLKHLGRATKSTEILKALDPKELSSLFKNFNAYAKEKHSALASIEERFDISKVLEFLKDAELPARTNRPTNEEGVLSLLQSLLTEPYQKAARYLLTFNELASGVKKCAEGNSEKGITPCPALNPLASAMEQINGPLLLMTNMFNTYCPS